MSKLLKHSPHLVAAMVVSLAFIIFGLVFTRTAPGCCELGKVVSVGFPFAYTSTSYQMDNQTISTKSFDQDGLILNIATWASSVVGIMAVALIVRSEMRRMHV